MYECCLSWRRESVCDHWETPELAVQASPWFFSQDPVYRCKDRCKCSEVWKSLCAEVLWRWFSIVNFSWWLFLVDSFSFKFSRLNGLSALYVRCFQASIQPVNIKNQLSSPPGCHHAEISASIKFNIAKCFSEDVFFPVVKGHCFGGGYIFNKVWKSCHCSPGVGGCFLRYIQHLLMKFVWHHPFRGYFATSNEGSEHWTDLFSVLVGLIVLVISVDVELITCPLTTSFRRRVKLMTGLFRFGQALSYLPCTSWQERGWNRWIDLERTDSAC